MMMKEKHWLIISPILILILSSLIHNVYDIFPNVFTSLFFPISESIWEHNKMIVLAFFIWMLLTKFIYKKKDICFKSAISTILCIILVLSIFTPIYVYILKMKDNLFITLTIYFIAIILSQILFEKLSKISLKPIYNLVGLIIWISIFIINIYFTFYPLNNIIFNSY